MIRGEMPNNVPFLALDKYVNITKCPEDFEFKIYDMIYVMFKKENESTNQQARRFLVGHPDSEGRITHIAEITKDTPETSSIDLEWIDVKFMQILYEEPNFFQIYRVTDTNYSFIIVAIQRIPEEIADANL